MTLNDYVRLFRERWIVIAVCIVLGLAGAGFATYTSPKQYQSTVALYMTTQLPPDNPSAAYSAGLFTQQRIKSYSELITSQRLSQDVINQLGLDQTADDLSSRITATVELDSVILTVAVTDSSPQRARDVANAIGDSFIRLASELDAPPEPARQPLLIAARAVAPASFSTAAISPKPTVNLALGGLIGIVIGLGAAFLRQFSDTSIKSVDELDGLLEAECLGSTAFDREFSMRPLVVHEQPQSAGAEAFRKIRTRLRVVDPHREPRAIVVTSAVAEEGRTTTVCNLAIAMAETGSRVLVVEADLRRPRVADYLGVERVSGFTNVLTGDVPLEQAVQKWRAGASFDVLTSGEIPPNPSALLGSQQMTELLERVRRIYDVVLIDTPPMVALADAAALMPCTDGAILIVRHGKAASQDVLTAAKALHAVSGRLLGTVLSMEPSKGRAARASYPPSDHPRPSVPDLPSVAATTPAADEGEMPSTADGRSAPSPHPRMERTGSPTSNSRIGDWQGLSGDSN